MSDESLGDLYRRMIARPQPGGRRDCPAPDALRAVAESEAGREERLLVMEHVSGCRECQRELALLGQVADAHRRAWRPTPAWWLAAAASLVLAAFAGRSFLSRGGPEPVMRGAAATVTLVSPVGSVDAAGAGRLVWRSVADAGRYEVEVLGPAADPVQSLTVRDTLAPLTAALDPGVEYRWRVTAVRRDGTRLESPLTAFRLRRD